MIYFQATKFTADHVDERIEAFIDWYVNDKLKVRYSEKATKISHFVLTLLSNLKEKVRDFFKLCGLLTVSELYEKIDLPCLVK